MSLLVFILTVVGITDIITSGRIFESFREWVKRKNYWLGYLVGCPMCLGFWCGVFFGIVGNPTGLSLLSAGAVGSLCSYFYHCMCVYLNPDD